MGFGMFSGQSSPIAIDFGSSSVKLLQISGGDKPSMVAAAEIAVPEPVRADSDKLFAFYAEWLPKFLRDGKFKGKRVVLAVPSGQTYTQHMQIIEQPGVSRDDLIKAQLQIQMGVAPEGVVVRAMDVGPVHRNGQAMSEFICFAISRETVMRYIDLIKRCKLEAVGVHTETLAMVRAFDHLSRRGSDTEVTTLFVDMGWGGTRVAVTHGSKLMFARYVPIGGRHFDQFISSRMECDVASARAHRLTLQSAAGSARRSTDGSPAVATVSATATATAAANGSGTPNDATERGATATGPDRRVGAAPAELRTMGAQVDFTELLDTITDELSMSLRYHQSLFRGRPIDRTIFVGGEARQSWLCQHLVKSLRVPAQLGDPLARYQTHGLSETPGLTLGKPQPGWAVACGLCNAPTDL